MNLKKTIKLPLLVAALAVTVLIACKGERDITKAPKGYSSNATLKAAYAIGQLELIETDFPLPSDIELHKDLVYKTVDSLNLKLDIYQPKSVNKKTPVILFIHGGSWRKGKKEDYYPYLIAYAQKGYITATVQYRLADDHKHPSQINDVNDAIIWLKQNAEQFQIDPDNVALVGGSAGGHLAMMAGYKPTLYSADSLYNNSVKAIVNFYGPVDLTTDFAKDNPAVTNFLGVTYQESVDAFIDASPLFFADKNAPPTIIFHGTIDDIVPVAQADRLNDSLKKLDVPVYYHRLEGWPHTMDVALEVNQYCQYYIDEFLNKHLAKP